MSISKEKQESYLQVIGSCGIQVWDYAVGELYHLIVTMMEDLGLIRHFKIPIGKNHHLSYPSNDWFLIVPFLWILLDKFYNFIVVLAKCYQNNPYHNFHHAVDVAQTIYYLAKVFLSTYPICMQFFVLICILLFIRTPT